MEDLLNLYEPYTAQGSRDRSTSDRPSGSTARTANPSEAGGGAGRRQRHSGADPHRRQTRYFQVNFPRGANSESTNFDATQSLEGLVTLQSLSLLLMPFVLSDS